MTREEKKSLNEIMTMIDERVGLLQEWLDIWKPRRERFRTSEVIKTGIASREHTIAQLLELKIEILKIFPHILKQEWKNYS